MGQNYLRALLCAGISGISDHYLRGDLSRAGPQYSD
jgi:hypothetical protein